MSNRSEKSETIDQFIARGGVLDLTEARDSAIDHDLLRAIVRVYAARWKLEAERLADSDFQAGAAWALKRCGNDLEAILNA